MSPPSSTRPSSSSMPAASMKITKLGAVLVRGIGRIIKAIGMMTAIPQTEDSASREQKSWPDKPLDQVQHLPGVFDCKSAGRVLEAFLAEGVGQPGGALSHQHLRAEEDHEQPKRSGVAWSWNGQCRWQGQNHQKQAESFGGNAVDQSAERAVLPDPSKKASSSSDSRF